MEEREDGERNKQVSLELSNNRDFGSSLFPKMLAWQECRAMVPRVSLANTKPKLCPRC